MELLLADLMYFLPGLIVVGAMVLIPSFVAVIVACNTGKTKLTKEEKEERAKWQVLLRINPHFKEEFVTEMEARVRCGLITEEEANKAIKEMYESYDRAYKN